MTYWQKISKNGIKAKETNKNGKLTESNKTIPSFYSLT